MKHQTSNTCIILAESSSGVKPSDQLSTTTFTPAFQDEKEEPAEEEEEADERLAREPSTVSIGKSPTTGLNVGAESGSKTSGIRYDYTFDLHFHGTCTMLAGAISMPMRIKRRVSVSEATRISDRVLH